MAIHSSCFVSIIPQQSTLYASKLELSLFFLVSSSPSSVAYQTCRRTRSDQITSYITECKYANPGGYRPDIFQADASILCSALGGDHNINKHTSPVYTWSLLLSHPETPGQVFACIAPSPEEISFQIV